MKNKRDKSSIKDILTKQNVHTIFNDAQNSGKSFVVLVVTACVLMVLSCAAIFLVQIKGAEKVLVPNVVGKDLTTALLELRPKELYPEIQLRYSNTPGDEGKVLEQSPAAGAIRKGYSRVSLVVSRGVVVDHVGNYVGQNIDDVQMNIQTLFAGNARPLIVIAPVQYKAHNSEAGTIIEQDPPEGTNISEPVTVHFIVSRGPTFDNTKVPNIVGNTVNDVLQQMQRTKIIFDFASHYANDNEVAGTVVRVQQLTSEFVPNYTRVRAEFAMPQGLHNGNMYGIFEYVLPEYPFAVPATLTATTESGDSYTVITFMHPGGKISIPYAVPRGTELVLSVNGKEYNKISVR
ncbi:MAG: PASTA domain-containing protein [Treponema sp.]|nr:PASTA domain-containing protein [Treponema sp.]